jgi:hypothetical protein
MKITIEPTEKQSCHIEMQNPKIEVWVSGDDHNLSQVLEYLVTPALRSYGFFLDQKVIALDLDA